MPDLFSIGSWSRFTKNNMRTCGWGLIVVFGVSLVVGFGLSQYTGGNRNRPEQAASDVVMTVNGQAVTHQDMAAYEAAMGSSSNGQEYAQQQGAALMRAVTMTLVQAEADKRNAQASDADIDAEIAKEKVTLGKNVSDAQWEQYVENTHGGMTASDYRQYLGKQLVGQALMNWFKAHQTVTDQDVTQQNDEVRLTLVLVPSAPAGGMPARTRVPALPDALAQAKAERLLADAKSGKDLGAIARQNSGDASARMGGDLGWRPEYKVTSPYLAALGALGFGKALDDAVHATQKGQFTPVVKTTGFSDAAGYAFAKVTDRRNSPPQGFDARKAADELRTERANQQLSTLLRGDLKAAKVEFKDLDAKTWYDSAKLDQMMQQMGQAMPGSDVVTPDQYKKQDQVVREDLKAMVKRRPDDAAAALMYARYLQADLNTAKTPAETKAIREQLISMYEAALNSTEDQETRFTLASLYQQDAQPDKAYGQYQTISKLMDADAPFDLASYNLALSSRQRLVAGLKALGKSADAAVQQALVVKLQQQVANEKKKQAEDARKQQAANALKIQQDKAAAEALKKAGGNASAPKGH